MTHHAPLLAALSLTACATSQVFVPPTQAASAERRLAQEDRFLRVSFFATPFFGDATKRLLTAVPPDQVQLLNHPDGTPVSPGSSEAIFPAGTPVRILRLELPSAAVMSERVLYTPRTLAWLYLDVGGTPKNAPPYVLVLRPGLRDEAELLAEVDRYLSRENLVKKLEALPDPVREAVKTKTAIVDMSSEALEMAWGYPERKKIDLDGQKRKETWTWADGKRVAQLVDGRVTQLK